MIAKLLNGESLSFPEAQQFMRQVMAGDVVGVKLAAALAALRVRGETAAEIAGFASAMREFALQVPHHQQNLLLDTCGTGGDGANTFNISTTAAFVVAAAGVPVAKHGNRAASSKSGSADVLEALGVNLEASPERLAAAIDEVGVGFLFARTYHPAMRFAAPVRAELGVRTVFNMLGPLTNPAQPTHQIMGVFKPQLTETIAEVLGILGSKGALVVHGSGLDEFTVCGETHVAELLEGTVREFSIHPEAVGLSVYPIEDLRGGHAQENAHISAQILRGAGTPAQRDVVALNAAAALYIGQQVPTLQAGVQRALDVLASGEGMLKLERYARFSHT